MIAAIWSQASIGREEAGEHLLHRMGGLVDALCHGGTNLRRIHGTTRTLKAVTVRPAAEVKVKSLAPRLSAGFRAVEESVRV